ncbi:MAG: hypothetical protein JWM75_403 [Sphingomonas bacterium]|nr:hypothetical protein [Sphingomonas bacterium]
MRETQRVARTATRLASAPAQQPGSTVKPFIHRSGDEMIRSKEYGGRTWARTKDPLIKSQLLYQLSYASMPVGLGGWAVPVADRPGSRVFCGCKHPTATLCHRARRLLRSIAIRMPMHSSTVIIAEPPNDTNGSGMPTTGASPITIIRLIAK